MLQSLTTEPTLPRRKRKSSRATKAQASNPPAFATGAALHPIYGSLTMQNDTLQRQPMFMLNVWHEKAIRFADEFFRTHSAEQADESPHYDELYSAAWDILQAALGLELKTGRDVALLLQIIARHAEDRDNVEWLDIGKLKSVASRSLKATAPEQPAKRPGPFARGRKLTRAGLLFRYQSFLTQELMTLGWNVYGNPLYATSLIAFDDEVTKRCTPDFKDGKYRSQRPSRRKSYPFLDEGKLTLRARAVLGSLQIDSETAPKRT